MPASPDSPAERPEDDLPSEPARDGEDANVLAGGLEGGEGMARAVGDAVALLDRRSPICPRHRSYERCLRSCSRGEGSISMPASNKLPIGRTVNKVSRAILGYSSKTYSTSPNESAGKT